MVLAYAIDSVDILDATIMPGQWATICVELLDEGTRCWRAVAAERVSEDTYRIVDRIPEDETWKFQPGDVVRCRHQDFDIGVHLTAYELVAKT